MKGTASSPVKPKSSLSVSSKKSGKKSLFRFLKTLISDLKYIRWKIGKEIALWGIITFAKDEREFLIGKTRAVIARMDKYNLVFLDSGEFVHNILDCFEDFGLSLEALNQFIAQDVPDEDKIRKVGMYSVIKRKEWERIFPKIVVFLNNKIITHG
jgi:hypothetical protein